jgi:hypothetical protein
MIDAIWLLLNRAPLDYARAASTWMLTGRHRDVATDMTDDIATITPNEREPKTFARKFGYAITGLAIVLIVGPVFVYGAYTILTSIMGL